MKSVEHQIKSTKEIINKFPKTILRPALNVKVDSPIEEKELKKKTGENWFYAKCQNSNDQLCANMMAMVWYCSNCQKIDKLDSEPKTETIIRKICRRYNLYGKW